MLYVTVLCRPLYASLLQSGSLPGDVTPSWRLVRFDVRNMSVQVRARRVAPKRCPVEATNANRARPLLTWSMSTQTVTRWALLTPVWCCLTPLPPRCTQVNHHFDYALDGHERKYQMHCESNASSLNVYLVRQKDGFKIPYQTIESITLIALLRMGLLKPIKNRFYDMFLQVGSLTRAMHISGFGDDHWTRIAQRCCVAIGGGEECPRSGPWLTRVVYHAAVPPVCACACVCVRSCPCTRTWPRGTLCSGTGAWTTSTTTPRTLRSRRSCPWPTRSASVSAPLHVGS